ncbi:MAG: glycosyltransferase family 9 protein [Opitutaceae bacterium]|nr:glycosyltransferase family 9 protein [Opitutaceae bacterium]
MQSFSSSGLDRRPRLLVVELWGLGDVALAVPFLQLAARHARVTLVAKPHAEPLVRRFCPGVELLPFTAPWTAFRGKYRLHRWPWLGLAGLVAGLRHRRFAAAVSARPDPRDHVLLAAAAAGLRAGFPRAGSAPLLNLGLPRPDSPHRFAHWQALATALGWTLPAPAAGPRVGRHVVIHTGAAQPTRQWPADRFEEIAGRLRQAGWQVTVLDGQSGGLDDLLDVLATADRFIGNDSGPGHLAALSGVPTFTIIGSHPPGSFHPIHPHAAWIEGDPCPFKPCKDRCRFAEPHCIRSISVDQAWKQLAPWLAAPAGVRGAQEHPPRS